MNVSEILRRLETIEVKFYCKQGLIGKEDADALRLARETVDRAATDALAQPTSEQRRIVLEEVASTPRPGIPGRIDRLVNDFADGTFPHGMGEVRRRARTEFEVAAIKLIEYCYPHGEWRGDRGTMRNLIGYVAKLRAALPTIELPPSGARVPRERWIPTADLVSINPCVAYAFKSRKTAERAERGLPVYFREVL